MADLEAAVGARLFERSTRGVALTHFCKGLLRSRREAFDACDKVWTASRMCGWKIGSPGW